MSWQARELLGVRAVPAAERDIVAYLPRGDAGSAGVFNGGRRIADEDALLDSLAAVLETRPERLEARGRFTLLGLYKQCPAAQFHESAGC